MERGGLDFKAVGTNEVEGEAPSARAGLALALPRDAGMKLVEAELSSVASKDAKVPPSQLSVSIITPGSSPEFVSPPPRTLAGFGATGAALGAGSFDNMETSDEAPAPRVVASSLRGFFAAGLSLYSFSAGSKASTLILRGPSFLRLDLLVGAGNCNPPVDLWDSGPLLPDERAEVAWTVLAGTSIVSVSLSSSLPEPYPRLSMIVTCRVTSTQHFQPCMDPTLNASILNGDRLDGSYIVVAREAIDEPHMSSAPSPTRVNELLGGTKVRNAQLYRYWSQICL